MEDDQFYIENAPYRVIGDDLDTPTLLDHIKTELIRSAKKEFDSKLEEYLIDNLKKKGIQIGSKKELIELLKNRVRILIFSENFNHKEFYLDYIDEQNRGTFIGSFNDKLNIKYEGNKIIATFGNQPTSKF